MRHVLKTLSRARLKEDKDQEEVGFYNFKLMKMVSKSTDRAFPNFANGAITSGTDETQQDDPLQNKT